MSTEEEENLPISDELTSNSLEKQALGLQHIVLLAEANKDVAVYFAQICQCGLTTPVTDAKGGITAAFRQQTYQAVRAAHAPATHESWSVVIDAVAKDLVTRDWQLRIAALKTLPFLPPSLLAKHIKAGTLDFQSNLLHLEPLVRQTAITVLAELVLYHASLRKVATVYGAPSFDEEVWGLIADRTFDENHFVVSTAFSALGVLFREAAGITRKVDYAAQDLVTLVRLVAQRMVAKLRLLFSLFTDLSDDLARPVVFPLVYLVSLLTVEAEAQQLPSVKGATCPDLVIEECVEHYLLPLFGASSPTLIYEVGIAVTFLSRYHSLAPTTWLLAVLTEYSNLLSCQLTTSGLFNLIKDIVPLLHLLPWEQIFATFRKLLLSVKLIPETHKRFELVCLITRAILFFDVQRISSSSDESQSLSLLIKSVGTDPKLNDTVWGTSHTIREEILGCLASTCLAHLTRSQASGKDRDVDAWLEEGLSLAVAFGGVIGWETGERHYAANSYLALVHQLALLTSTLPSASTEQKQRINELLSSTFFTKLLAIKDDATCIKVVYLLCAHIRGWVLTKDMAVGIVAVIKRRFLNLDAVDARSQTLRVTARAGKLGTGNRQTVPTPDMLESPLACLLQLAVKCPEVRTHVCEEILRRLMAIHANDELLLERCEYYLQRIAFVSARFKENREDEERKEKERERERVKTRKNDKNGGTSGASSNSTNGGGGRRSSRPKKEKKEKKSAGKTGVDKKGGETLKKAKKGENRTMRTKKKEKEKEKSADKAAALPSPAADGSSDLKKEATRPLNERVEDVQPYLDFSAFLPAETTTPFDHSSPDDEFYVAFKLFGDLSALPSSLINAPDGFLHYYVARERDVTSSVQPSPLPTAAIAPVSSSSSSSSSNRPRVLISGPSDPFAVYATHTAQPDLSRIKLRFELTNVTMSPVENVKLSLSSVGHVLSVLDAAQTHKVIAKAESGERVEWEVDFIVKSFSYISFHLQVLVPYEKDPSFLMIQGGRGGIGGGMGNDAGQSGLVYRPLACLPYPLPAHHLLHRRPYAAHEFHALWNRFGASWAVEVRFRAGLEFNAIAAALSSTPFVPVIKSINPQTLHMALCGCTWFGEQLFFTVSAGVGERGAVEALLECRASSPLALRSFAGLMETGWLSSLFTTPSSPSSPSSSSSSSSSILHPHHHHHQQQQQYVQRPAVESIRRGERSAFSHFLSTSPSSSLHASLSSSFFAVYSPSSPGNSASFPSIASNGIPSSSSASSSSSLSSSSLAPSNVPSSSSSAPSSSTPSAPSSASIGSSLSSYGSGSLDLDSGSSSSIPYSVLLHSRAGASSKTILTRWLDAYRT